MFAQKINYSELIVPNGDIHPCAIEQFPAKEFFQNECALRAEKIKDTSAL